MVWYDNMISSIMRYVVSASIIASAWPRNVNYNKSCEAMRGQWNNLRSHARKISVSDDLPAMLPPLEDNLMLTRRKLATNLNKPRVRYPPQWPFVEIRIDGLSWKRPQETETGIKSKSLGFNHVFSVVHFWVFFAGNVKIMTYVYVT